MAQAAPRQGRSAGCSVVHTGRANRGASDVQPAHLKEPLLTVEQLAQFATPKTWAEIFQLQPRMLKKHWRAAIVDADEFGFGLLTRLRHKPNGDGSPEPSRSRRGAWVLSDEGRAYVERELAKRSSLP